MATKTTPRGIGAPRPSLRRRALLPPWAAVVVWSAVALGAALRLRHYLANRSLWLDEALLANALVGKPFAAIFAPLGNDQAAPVGFLAAVRSSVALFGSGEPALRLASLGAGLLSLPLFLLVARRYLSAAAVPVGAVGFALAAPLLYYAAELKPYGVDVLAALLAWLLGAALLDGRGPRRLGLVAGAGALLPWLSYPAALTLAGVGATLIGEALIRRDRANATGRLAVTLVWAVSAAAVYELTAHYLMGNRFLSDYWADAFAPLPPRSLGDLRWYLERPMAVFGSDVAGFQLPGMAALLALAGCASMAPSRPAQLALLLAPFGAALAGSAFGHYPFEGRLLLFLAPDALMLVAEGLVWLHTLVRPQAAWLAPVAGLLLAAGLLVEARGLIVAPAREELRPVLETVYAEARPGDAVYIYYGAKEAARYYEGRLGAPPVPLTYGAFVRGDLPALAAELRGLPRGRAWVVFSHVAETDVDEERFSLYVLDQLGTRIKQVRRPGAVAYLYQLSQREVVP